MNKLLPTTLLVLFLAGCQSNHLIYVQETSLGLTIAASAEGSNKMSLGYDRDVYAIVPKKTKESDAMSLFSVNKVEITGLDDMSISEFVASGKPAEDLAVRPDAIKKLRQKVYGDK
ncbi:hypothetical protein Q4557_19475 [Shewanella sp. 5_MG-2023]|uniref:hypothetical protein n=1 Tax=Shewanella sp. 5_MG-2023 TaxID=3062656 RepID=UPI0026E3A3E3|nr:hypothetical protein [Shewanella sp. 5_MG-2023]MDO6642131.1 hypothetical protein [Shewanella sp. 5_MG-2023]